MLRGSRVYSSLVIGSTMLQISDSVGVCDERIDHRGGRVRHDQHVGGVDRLPAADRRAVEAEALLEDVLLELADRIVKCCQMPRKSMNLRSTILRCSSLRELQYFLRCHAISLLGLLSHGADCRAGLQMVRRWLSPRSPVRMRTTSSTGVTKILPSPMRPGPGGLLDRLDHLLDLVVVHDDLELHLGQEVDHVLGAAVELGVPLLAAEALDLGDGDALDADLVRGPPSPRRA